MPWLPEAAASIASQPGVEWIVLDGGSTDGSREWLRENAASATLVFEPDRGQTDALIRGLSRARGDVLAWLNADDLYESGALERVAQEFDEHPEAVAVSGRCLWIDRDGSVTGEIPTVPDTTLTGLLACTYNLPQPATFFRADAYRRVGGLDPARSLAMDVDLWLKLARVGEIRQVDDVLARFRLHPAAKTQAGALAAIREDFAVRRRQGLSLGQTWWTFARWAYLNPWYSSIRSVGRRLLRPR